MAYFLKKTKLRNDLYLQIYESYYHHEKKETAHRSHSVVGYVSDLIASGINDPVAHYKEVVRKMNEELERKREENKQRQISSSPERHVGFFLLKAVFEGLAVTGYLDLLQTSRSFQFRIAELIEALTYCRVTEPCSKSKTFQDVLPSLYGNYSFSYDQILDGVEFIGFEYEKIIEIFNHQIQQKYPQNTSTTYFDSTNFFFEIDQEDVFRRKGPSKENRRSPIVGLGLLLDAHQVPIGMKLFPGNESEKPVIRDIIRDLKTRNSITGRTVQVADKGLNCANNILAARKNGDGYIFSKSVKSLPAKEKTWVLLDSGYRNILDEKGAIRYRIKDCVDKFPYNYTDENDKTATVMLTEKRVVTFNPKLAEKKRYEILRMVEKAKTLKAAQAKRDDFGDCSKYVLFTPINKKGEPTSDKISTSLNQDAIEEDLKLAGYNLLVSSEIYMKSQEIYSAYHNLWRIEESFRVMKSYLDARPVYLQKRESIYGHFLICYISVLLIRILQFHVFKNQYCTERFIDFVRNFRIVEIDHNKYINITSSSDVISSLADTLSLPITNFFLSSAQLKKMLSLKL